MNVLKSVTVIKSFLQCPSFTFLHFRCIKYRLFPMLKEFRKRKDKLGISAPTQRNTFLEWNYKSELYSFGKRLNEEFNEILLRKAFTDHSYVTKLRMEQEIAGIQQSIELPDNREMTDSGEQIISDFTELYLRHTLPRFPEEGIRSIKNYLLSVDVLSQICFSIGTPDLILCKEYPADNETLVRVLKALVFALKESSGLERTSLFIRDYILTQLAEFNINDLWQIEDPISTLNKICKNECVDEPEPRIIGSTGVNSLLALYRVGLYINKELIGVGAGETVKTAHEMAATDTLRRLFGTAEHQLLIPWDIVLDPATPNIPNISIENWSRKTIKIRC